MKKIKTLLTIAGVFLLLTGGVVLCNSCSEAAGVKIVTKGKKKNSKNDHFDFEIRIKGISSLSTVVKMSSSMPITIHDGSKRFTLSKKPHFIYVKNLYNDEYDWEEGESADEYLDDIDISLEKKKNNGKFKFNIEVADGGKTLIKKQYNLCMTKLDNPFRKFIVAGKDFSKEFDERLEIGDAGGLTRKDIKSGRFMGGKPYSIVLKSGYKLTGVYYVKWEGFANTGTKKWTNRKTMPGDYRFFIIRYKDKQNKKGERAIRFYGS